MMTRNAWLGTKKAKKEIGYLLTVTSKDLAKRFTFGLLSKGWPYELSKGMVVATPY